MPFYFGELSSSQDFFVIWFLKCDESQMAKVEDYNCKYHVSKKIDKIMVTINNITEPTFLPVWISEKKSCFVFFWSNK